MACVCRLTQTVLHKLLPAAVTVYYCFEYFTSQCM